MSLTRCYYNNQVLRELANTQLSFAASTVRYLWIKLICLSSKNVDQQVFIKCWLNESEESNVTHRSHNIGTKFIAELLILTDLVFSCQSFSWKKYGFGFCHHSFAVCCGTSMFLHLKSTVLCFWFFPQFQMVCTICRSVSSDEKLDMFYDIW